MSTCSFFLLFEQWWPLDLCHSSLIVVFWDNVNGFALHWSHVGFLGFLLPIYFSSYTSQGACLSYIPFISLWGWSQRKIAYWLPLLVGCKSKGLLAYDFTILGKMGDVEGGIIQIFHRTTTTVEILYWCHIFVWYIGTWNFISM